LVKIHNKFSYFLIFLFSLSLSSVFSLFRMNEIKKWMPSVNALMYHGSKENRKEIQENFFPSKNNKKRKNAPPVSSEW